MDGLMAKDLASVLVVDDEEDFRRTLCELIELRGFHAVAAENGAVAEALVRVERYAMAIVDYVMPGMDGLVTITKLKEVQPGLRTVLLTGQGGDKLRQATEALGSVYLEKSDMGALWDLVSGLGSDQRAIFVLPDKRGGSVPGEWLRDMGRPGQAQAEPRLIGDTRSIRVLCEEIARAADLESPVLVTGEEGAGKEHVARMIHAASYRRGERFACVDCGFLGPETVAREVFGVYDPGPGRGRAGLVETCAGGTLLLNNLCGAPWPLQRLLLEALLNRRAARIGGGEARTLDVRIVASCTGDFDAMVAESRLLPGLRDAFGSIRLRVPPLRERVDDIPPLCAHFVDRFARESGRPARTVSREVLDIFMAWEFPGNVRELESVIERAVILCEGETIGHEHLPRRFQERKAARRFHGEVLPTLAELEESYIREVMEATGGNKSEAARILGINRTSLWRKLKDEA